MSDAKAAICRICKEGCGLLVSRTKSGLKIRGNPEHPVSQGFACFRGLRYGHVHDSPHRLDSALLRTKSGWKAIPHADAADIMAEKLLAAARRHGAPSICCYKGESLKHQENTSYLRHLFNGLGSPNYHSCSSICHYSMALGYALTLGGIPAPDFGRINCAVIWGCNPATAFRRLHTRIKQARNEGLKIIVVDPSPSATTKLADLHLPLRPGGDGYLALAFLKYFSERGWAASPESTLGWPDLRDGLASLSLTELLSETDIEPRAFHQAADMLAGNVPAWIETGLGLELQPGGVQTVRAIAALQVLLDPLARPATPWGKLPPLPGSQACPDMPPPVGAEEFPVYTRRLREGQAMRLPRAILRDDPYPVRAMLVAGANPMLTLPDPALFGKALDSLDFLAVFDLFMTDTAQRADLVFPAATHLEFHELHDYAAVGQPYLGLVSPVEDTGRGWPLWRLVFELADRMGLRDLFPWRDNRQALTERMAGSGIEFHDLAASPSLTAPYPVPPVKPDVWPTSDGRAHFRSDELASVGQQPVPALECFAPPVATSPEFPFFLSTGDRSPYFQHSQFHNIPDYQDRSSGPMVDMHPDAAHGLGLLDGATATLATPFGRLDIAVRLDPGMRPDCLRLGHGWGEANANALGCFDHLDPISGFPWLKALPASITSGRSG